MSREIIGPLDQQRFLILKGRAGTTLSKLERVQGSGNAHSRNRRVNNLHILVNQLERVGMEFVDIWDGPPLAGLHTYYTLTVLEGRINRDNTWADKKLGEQKR